jgi:protein-disulfide isomerase
MAASEHGPTPKGHTEDGGVLVGDANAPRGLVVFEDPQCPYCRQFEEVNGSVITAGIARGDLAVEYRMRCFLGPESVRADNALALAAEAGRFDELRQELFAHQPEEGAGGFTIDDLLDLGAHVGLRDQSFVAGVRQARYEQWVVNCETRFSGEDPQGTPAAWLNGGPVEARVLFSPEAFDQLLRS